MSQAIQYTQLGGPEVLTLVEVPFPEPAPGTVTVRVEAAGVNPIDWKLRSGLRATPPFEGPRGTGSDGAGTIAAVGEGVDGFRVGDAVAFCNAAGAYATDVVVSAAHVFPGLRASRPRPQPHWVRPRAPRIRWCARWR